MTLNQKKEGLERLTTIVKKYNLNPNLIKYLEEDKLYYSYVHSVDTIEYDPSFAQAVRDFEKETGGYVYHVIEVYDIEDNGVCCMAKPRENNRCLIFLYVSTDEAEWEYERLHGNIIKGYVAYLDGENSGDSIISLSAPTGVLIGVAASEDQNESSYDDDLMSEALDRINILQEQGMLTDLNIEKMLVGGEECVSEANIIFGDIVGVIMPISEMDQYSCAMAEFESLGVGMPYFCMGANTSTLGYNFTVLFVPEDDSVWDMEKKHLKNKMSLAYVYNMDDNSGKICLISYDIFNGGPIMTEMYDKCD